MGNVWDIAELTPVEITTLAGQNGQDRLRRQIGVQRQACAIRSWEAVAVVDVQRCGHDSVPVFKEEIECLAEVPTATQLLQEHLKGRLSFIDHHAISEMIKKSRQRDQ